MISHWLDETDALLYFSPERTIKETSLGHYKKIYCSLVNVDYLLVKEQKDDSVLYIFIYISTFLLVVTHYAYMPTHT